MIVEYLRYTIDAGRAEEFIAAYDRATTPLLSSPHCLAFDLSRCVEDSSQFILRVEWTSAEKHLKGFRGSAEFRAFFAEVKPFVGDIEEMRHYERLIDRRSD